MSSNDIGAGTTNNCADQRLDKILLAGIQVFAHGGVTEAERKRGQHYEIDVELSVSVQTASTTDDLSDTADYSGVHLIVERTLREGFNLIERPAVRIAESVLDTTLAQSVTVRVRKLSPPVPGPVRYAEVEVTRTRT